MALLDFERFGITAEDVKTGKYSYIIGFDLGDGEVSAAYWDLSDIGCEAPANLKFDKNNEQKLLSGLFLDENGNAVVGPIQKMYGFQEAKGRLFTNFKIPPHRLKAGEKYENSGKTNLWLMQTLLKEVILEINKISLRSNFYTEDGEPKKGILAIGCPSSPEWTSNGMDVEYATMLEKALIECPLDLKIVIMPESRASLIKVYKEQRFKVYKEQRSLNDQIENGVIVADHGSSTLDITMVDFAGNEQYDFSIPLGAKLIERKILRNAVTDDGRKESDIKGGMNGIVFQRLGVRIAKEACFTNPSGVYRAFVEYCDDDDCKIKLTCDSMHKVTHESSVTYSTSETGSVSGSWAELHKQFILKCLRNVGRNFSPDKFNGVVILTGGASKMQFVEENVKDIFSVSSSEVAIMVDTEPSYCVSKGLAWAAYTDLMALKLIDTVKQQISDFIRTDFPTLKGLIAKQLSPIIYAFAKEKLAEWVETGDDETISALAKRIEKEFFDTDTAEGKNRNKTVYETIKKAVTEYLTNSSSNGVRAMIVKVVNDVFSSTFPGHIGENSIKKFDIEDEDWNNLIKEAATEDLKFSSSLVQAMDLEKALSTISKAIIAILLIIISPAISLITFGRVKVDDVTERLGKMFFQNQKLSKSQRQSVYQKFVEKNEETISTMELEISKVDSSTESSKMISDQILNILTPAIDRAVDTVSIYF